MKTIELTQGKAAIVDDGDFEELSKYKWYAFKNKNIWYAARSNKRRNVYMHREIAGAPKGAVVDHINGNGLDNRHENLRVCSSSENVRNSGISSRNTSGYKGVSFHKALGRYRAGITVNRKIVFLGYFPTAQEAARTYDVAAKQYHGEFARINGV